MWNVFGLSPPASIPLSLANLLLVQDLRRIELYDSSICYRSIIVTTLFVRTLRNIRLDGVGVVFHASDFEKSGIDIRLEPSMLVAIQI